MSAIFYKDNPYGGTTTVTDAGHVLVTQGSDTTTAQAKFNTQTTAIQRILGNFATVEQSTTASKAYNVGDYLVLNSFLYKVTQAIAAGGTIDNTQNGNVVKITVADEFSNASNVQYDNTTSGLTATDVQGAVDELESTKADNNDSGPGYCKMPDGTLIQWGSLILALSGEMSQVASSGIYVSPVVTINLPFSFIAGSFMAYGMSKYSTGYNLPLAAWSSADAPDTLSFQVYDFYKRPLNDGLYRVRWTTIGRWK